MSGLAFCKVDDHVRCVKVGRKEDEGGVKDDLILLLNRNSVVSLLSTIVIEALFHSVLHAVSFLSVFVGVLNTLIHARNFHLEEFVGDLSTILTVYFELNRVVFCI